MVSRREWLRLAAGAGAAMMMKGCARSEAGLTAEAAATTVPGGQLRNVMTRAIPSSGEQLPVIGLGGGDVSAIRRRLDALPADMWGVNAARTYLALSTGDTARARGTSVTAAAPTTARD